MVNYINESTDSLTMVTEYSQIKDDIDVSGLFKQGTADTKYYMIFYNNDELVDVVGYDTEDDITGDDERTTDKFTAKVWALNPGETVTWGKNIWTRIR